ncbi:Peptidyl-prolyl cis-trans isomerase-like 4 [Strongyloides ratti]|uniref:Peptidyl-prolyl cis-trans isomerase n=1 Tax=Strongyloides ratti TaxID=34506 RepID=A0A090LDD0_STRRB|nr:Peptidyl-prolyl cis-trans isomerase-like 4 [Strongyloides ratti]CEF67786.1 Peptidyl-prolyl cis-trans isomerase-like 4 [Strongyloides ratti]
MSVLIETTLGDIVVDLYIKEKPKSCLNFIKLCKAKYYNNCQFFCIQNNFIAQTGDPTNKGDGGECIYSLIDKNKPRYMNIDIFPKLRHIRKGTISFINNGRDEMGSQFFFTLSENLDYLDGKHNVFGHVSEGIDVIDKLNAQICTEKTNSPYRDIRIAHTIILDDTFDDPEGFCSRDSPIPGFDFFQSHKIALDEDINNDNTLSESELIKEIEKQDMNAQAQILEMVGDLHDANEKPPDNVLFVCKLNPITSDDDLMIIFSRFGKIIDCEVIRDRRTGNSLQYAFIAFETPEQCENAFFKMDNVIIDDRRIHVDFSQSVSKNYQWKKYGNH